MTSDVGRSNKMKYQNQNEPGVQTISNKLIFREEIPSVSASLKSQNVNFVPFEMLSILLSIKVQCPMFPLSVLLKHTVINSVVPET